MSSLNYLELCRLCLVKDRVQIPIFEEEGDIRQIFLKIAACLPVKVNKDDKLPKKICNDCMYKVEMLYQFRNTAENAEKRLLEWLGEAVEEKKCASDSHVKQESLEQDPCSELAKSLSRVEAVLAEARETESDTDQFASAKPETDSDDEPLSTLETTSFVNVDLDGTGTTESHTQGEFLAPGAPSTSKTISSTNSQTATSGEPKEVPTAEDASKPPEKKKYSRKKKYIDRGGPRKCSMCDYVAVLHRMIIHERRHTGERPFKCKVCGKSFMANGTLSKHYLTHVGGTPFECEVCHKRFKLKNALYIHKRMHTIGKCFTCEVCGYAAYQKSNLDLHKRRHFADYKFTCSECKKGFYLRHEYENHLNTHTGEKPFKCEICGKCYPFQSSLHYHMNSHNPSARVEVKNYHCDKCSMSFTAPSRLNKHMRTHTGERPFICNTCGKGVSTKESLADHIRIHTGEKPHKCNYCSKAFIKKTLLKVHERTHTGEKPYLCMVCGKDFTQQSSLSIHMKSHQDEKQYKCEECNLCFASKALYLAHDKNTHSRVPPENELQIPSRENQVLPQVSSYQLQVPVAYVLPTNLPYQSQDQCIGSNLIDLNQ
ncbi:hypothetical protein RUM43_003439 [Polyplax serrata]|uniref:Uncharacterized protein n=1 Tax=Polyplax serrata TaxID=468196 RepID=A0AAN8PPD1_POLSC